MNSGGLILSAYFQRNLVWRDVHKKEFIDTILQGLPFPQIFLARGTIDVDSLKSSTCVVDGQQRLSAIRDFVSGDIEVDGKYFGDLSKEEKAAFLKYEVAVIDFDLEPDDARLQDIFQRLNRTYYALSSVEKLSAEFGPSELMVLAKALIGEFDPTEDDDFDETAENPFKNDPNIPTKSLNWANKHGKNSFADLIRSDRIFSTQDVRRKVPLMIILNIICSSVDGYYVRNNEVKRYLEEYKEFVPNKEEVFDQLCRLATGVFSKLEDNSIWLNKANFFTICVEVLMASPSNVNVTKLLKGLRNAEKKGLSVDYLLAAREGVNNKKERELRGKFVSRLVEEAAA